MFLYLQMFLTLWVFMFVETKPNFILILTDDQDLLLNGLVPMNRTLKLIANYGKVFENAFVNSPICCPSRSTILTGKYAHNTGVVNNSIDGNCSSTFWQKRHEPFSMASVLKDNGYVTFYAGKYLNQYGSRRSGGVSHVPKGYDWWYGLEGNSKYYNYSISVNGTGFFYADMYLTDLLVNAANYGVDFLNNRPKSSPFFMTVATPASHAPFTPAERHEHVFANVKALRTPSFNYTPTDKHWIVSMPPQKLPGNVSILDDIQKRRLQTLLAVDELVEKLINKLKESLVLDDTYIIFTSDNGYHIGQFTQPWDKRQPYETDIRVPMLVRGPGIPRKTLESYPVSSVDLAPTILELADVEVPGDMDGKSFKNVLTSKERVQFVRHIFVEYWGEGNARSIDGRCPWKYDRNLAECSCDQWCKCQDSKNNTYTCVIDISNKQTFKFCRFEDDQGFIEAYNITEDPYELSNCYLKMDKAVVESYLKRLERFEKCSGKKCDIFYA